MHRQHSFAVFKKCAKIRVFILLWMKYKQEEVFVGHFGYMNSGDCQVNLIFFLIFKSFFLAPPDFVTFSKKLLTGGYYYKDSLRVNEVFFIFLKI